MIGLSVIRAYAVTRFATAVRLVRRKLNRHDIDEYLYGDVPRIPPDSAWQPAMDRAAHGLPPVPPPPQFACISGALYWRAVDGADWRPVDAQLQREMAREWARGREFYAEDILSNGRTGSV